MDRSLLLLMIAAPLLVVGLLLAGAGVAAVFGVYQVGICLLLPAALNVGARRLGWRGHLRHLGLAGPGSGRAVAFGLALAVVCGGGTLAIFAGWGRQQLAAEAVVAALAAWGLGPQHLAGMLPLMALVSGPAEELFWRGFCATELAAAPRWQRLLLPSLLYFSYHAVTVTALMPQPALAASALAGVAGAGVGWAWLRERTGSVWPALLSHGAVAAAYTLVAVRLLGS
ncbi:MAG: CPBP family intramembrane glutamic endopeptidase [Candidatus Krumholzibacteriia bacterium]